MAKLKKYFDKLEEVLGVSILFVMLVILSYQIILRFVFKNSNSWSEETARYLFVWFVYVTASLAVLKNAHIRIDAFLGVCPRKAVRGVVVAGYGVFLAYCLAIVWYSSLFTAQIIESEQISLGLEIPMYLVWLSLPICHGLMAIRTVQRIWHVCVLKEPIGHADPELTT